MTAVQPLTWAVLGTANIARAQLLPALAEAGGRAAVVAGRDGARTAAWAAEHGVERAVQGYAAALADPAVDAVYVALPNSLHVDWTIAALEAGKAVLCEKPMSTSVADTERVLAAAERTGGLLWESFVFPFGPQYARVASWLAEGAVGPVREIESAFHFRVRRPDDIRLSAALGGGSVADVGCYPIRLAQLVFGTSPDRAQVSAVRGAEVETDAAGVLDHLDGRRLWFSCGFDRAYDTTTRIIGTDGWISLDNPFHPGRSDTITLTRPGADPVTERAMTDRHSFTGAVRHVTAAVRAAAPPRHLALDDALATARTVEMVQALV